MNKRNIQAVYPLSPMQQGMLFHSLYAPGSGVYVEQMSCIFGGNLDVPAFERAWQHVVERHPILRTSFAWKSLEKVLQVVQREVRISLEQEDWRGIAPLDQVAQLEDFLQADRRRGFDVSRAPLMRLSLMRTAEDSWQFVWTHHHALLDGWSVPLLLKEVLTLYEAAHQGQEQTVSIEQPRPYRDYIAWLQKQDVSEAEAFWRKALKGFSAPTPLVVDRPASGATCEMGHAELETRLSVEATTALQSLARKHQLTMNTLVQGAWAILLSRYSGERDVVFGATVSGRPADLPGAELMLGLFINTLPVRVRVQPDAMLLPWLKELQALQVEMRHAAREQSPLVHIQGWSEVPRDQPLFESILVFENYPTDALLQHMARSVRIHGVRTIEKTNFPLTVVSGPGQELVLKISYDVCRFDRAAVKRMLGHLQTLLEGFVADPHQPLSTLPLLTEPERHQLLVEWNNTAAEYPCDRCIHQLFEEQVERMPDAVAVVFEEQALTYRELNQRANQLAHYLQRHRIGPEALVGLFVERSPEAIVGLLGILKAGSAYMPVDPTYPKDRIAFMLKDAQVPMLLTQSRLLPTLPMDAQPSSLRVICLDADWGVIAHESDTNLINCVTGNNLAYVIYTSGSTGQPKGVMVRHGGLLNHAIATTQLYELTPNDRMLQFISLSFDASAEEIFPTLISGATLVLWQVGMELGQLAAFCEHQRITFLHLPAAFWHQWVDQLEPGGWLSAVRILVVGGESPFVDKLEAWRRLANGSRFVNAYGPTEATVATAVFQTLCDESIGTLTRTPIGRPIANNRIYLLDRDLHLVPIGVPGELFIGGAGLARGYLNRPDLTAERFIPNHFADTGPQVPDEHDHSSSARNNEEPTVLYRTGDIARFLPDGNIEITGRTDDQVKVRGFRIELGEIESVLRQHPDLREAVVVVREDRRGDKQLVAYVVPGDERGRANHEDETSVAGPSRIVGTLREFLRKRLPEFMVPTAFVIMAEGLPRLPNGKVNRCELPGPEGTFLELETAYVAPRTPNEELVAGIWARVLGVERVGIHDNFFDLGGHSLLATQLLSRIREAFRVELPLRNLFEEPSVARQVIQIEAAQRRDAGLTAPPIRPIPRGAGIELPLSFAQQRLWFLDQLEPGNLFYNIPTAVRLTGTLDVQALVRSLNEIVRRHEVLRTTFVATGGRPVQVISPELNIPVPITDLRDLSTSGRETETSRRAAEEARVPFDLGRGPLLRAQLLRLDEQEHVALFTMHHIASDGWSMGVFIQELVALYRAFSQRQSVERETVSSMLAALPIQYADFGFWQREWLRGEVLEHQLAYWRTQLAGSPTMLELPTDRPRPAVQSSRGAQLPFALSRTLSDAVKALSRQEGVTLFMTLLAAFQALLHRYSGQDDICVGTPIANRTRAEIENVIGFFVNTLVLRADLSGNPSFRDLLKQVREVTLGAYAHQDLPFEVLVESIQPQRDLSHTPLFQVMFVLDNAPRPAITLPGLAITPLPVETGRATFDLTLSLMDGQEGLIGYVEYNTDLFDETTIQRMLGHYQVLLHAAVSDSGIEHPVATLPMLTKAEWDQTIIAWNKTYAEFPREHCIHWLFEDQVEQRPEAIAVTFEDKSLTYRELNRRANCLAHYLRRLGVGPDVLVGISTERSIEMVVGILGILKAGGAYLPLDPSYPADRLAFMLQDSTSAEFGMRALLTQEHVVERLPAHKAQVVRLDADWVIIAQESDKNLSSGVTPESLAYVIYTSGSTGKPKGAMLRHRGLCNLASWQQKAFGIVEGSRVLQFSPLSFDASVWEIFMALRNGGTLCLARQETLASGPDLVRLMQEQGVTTVTLPPSVLAALDAPPDSLPTLRTIIAAGEACPSELATRWGQGRQFFNAYGPTETTVCASMALCDPDDVREPSIGRPIANMQLYILDKHLQPVPVGVPGELHVGGVGLASGYLNRPELSSEKFIRHPFHGEPEDAPPDRNARLYKTGDLVRYRSDGNIEFLGRIDQQVKVRGFRIELGEIEAVLRQHEGVQDAVAVAREDTPGDRRVVAYIVQTHSPASGTEHAHPSSFASELRAHLKQHLPEYMVPSTFVMLETLPLSPSGKADRTALPAPEGLRPEIERAYVAPRTPIEEKLAAMCADLLRLDRVGVHDSFFELGGHSLLATQFVSRVREGFGVELPLKSIFEGPTVADLAAKIGQSGQEQHEMDTIAQMLTQVQQLDESDVRALLAEKRP